MPGTPRPDYVATKRQRIAALARSCPDLSFTNLAHHIDLEWMLTAHGHTRRDGAVGVDGQTADEYEVNLEANLQNLLDRAKSGTYMAPPVRRVHIPKAGSATETRPLGIPTYFDFLGFTHYWGRSRQGAWVVKRKTASSRLKRALAALSEWCRKNLHAPIKEQHQKLVQKLRGH